MPPGVVQCATYTAAHMALFSPLNLHYTHSRMTILKPKHDCVTLMNSQERTQDLLFSDFQLSTNIFPLSPKQIKFLVLQMVSCYFTLLCFYKCVLSACNKYVFLFFCLLNSFFNTVETLRTNSYLSINYAPITYCHPS